MSVLNSGLIAPNTTSTDQQWIVWYDYVKSDLGKQKADLAFVKAWASHGRDKANTNSLREHMEKNGIKVTGGTLAAITDTYENVLHKVGGLFNLGGAITLIILGIMVFLVVLTVWRLATPQTAGIVAKSFV